MLEDIPREVATSFAEWPFIAPRCADCFGHASVAVFAYFDWAAPRMRPIDAPSSGADHKMNVQLVIPAYLPARAYGGPIAKVERLAMGLMREGISLCIVTSDLSGPGKASLPVGFDRSTTPPVLRLRSRVSFRWSSWGSWPSDLGSPDILHVIGAWNGLSYQAIARALRRRIPVIWEPAGMLAIAGRHTRIKAALTPIHRALAERVSAIIWTSNQERAEAPFRVADERSYIRPNPAPSAPTLESRQEARRRFGFGDEFVWGYLGRIGNRKGIDTILEAWKLAGPSRTDRLVFAGPAESASLQSRILGTRNGVSHVGALDRGACWSFLQAIDGLMLVPEFGENFGNVVVEAVMVGTPVVVSPAVGAREFCPAPAHVYVATNQDDLIRIIRNKAVQRGEPFLPPQLAPQTIAAQQAALYRRLCIARSQ